MVKQYGSIVYVDNKLFFRIKVLERVLISFLKRLYIL